ncbi:MAG TPA: iron uptake transporter deferrochelatase/peroxidase subunit [Candidatus Limnocylindrales bacterium]
MTEPQAESPLGRRRVSRRAFLGVAAGGAAAIGIGGLAAVGGLDVGALTGNAAATAPSGERTYPFAGAHQAGIVTPAQDRMYTAAFDLTTTSRDELIALLRAWTTMSARLRAGLPAGPYGPTSGPYDAPPDDTGEAMDLPPAGLTVTIGFGRSLFVGPVGAPTDRFGLADRLPAGLVTLPHFPGDDLDPARSDGDLIVQACADDPQVAMHAVRNLTRAGFGTARIRWSQLGFGRTSSTSTAQATPRNLLGFKDGTANVKAEETAAVEEHVWVQPGDEGASGPAAWLTGGTFLAVRRIRMVVETWDRSALREQEQIIGRSKAEGAPLSGGTEFTEPDFGATGAGGLPLIAADSHVRLAHPSLHNGVRMLRRGYNFTDGNDKLGRLDAGLFFAAFVRDPRTGFIPIQDALARTDALREYLVHTGSGLFAVPPGVPSIGSDGSLIGDAFLGAGLFA